MVYMVNKNEHIDISRLRHQQLEINKYSKNSTSNSDTSNKLFLEKIKRVYFPLLKEHIKELIILKLPDLKNKKKGYVLSMGRERMEFRQKENTSTTITALNLKTSIVCRNDYQTKDTPLLFKKILETAFLDLKQNKATITYTTTN